VSVFFWLVVRLSITALVLATLAVAVACDDGEAESDKIQVVTTLPLFADMIENVGGDRVEVTALLPSGADPHTWEPSPQDAKKVSEADIIFANGLELEPAALSFIEANAPSDVPVVKIGGKSPFLATESSLTLLDEYEFDPEFVSSGADPHLWLHPRNAIVYSEVFRNMLTGVDPMGVDIYQANYQAYASSLEELEQSLIETVSDVPDEHRRLITTHDAFRYLAGALRFEIEAFVAAGPGSEASPDDIAVIVSAVEEQDIPAVFVEPQVDSESETLAQIAEDTGAEICTLYSDALDDEVTSYIAMMRFNADEIARCLGSGDGG
jgi:ABC-type Zn uptake system ZnuABC Zn-binding protein ZnuA